MEIYDAVVAGLGIHGSSTIAQLAERGKKVIGFEKFQQGGHPHGSSHGRSRIIRQAYFEDPRCENSDKIILNLQHILNIVIEFLYRCAYVETKF